MLKLCYLLTREHLRKSVDTLVTEITQKLINAIVKLLVRGILKINEG
jgi:hypothetical protein